MTKLLYQRLYADSYLEYLFLKRVLSPATLPEIADLIVPQFPIKAENNIYKIDFGLIGESEKKYAIELDGYTYHKDHATFNSDRERNNYLVTKGWQVIHFTYKDVTQQPGKSIQQLQQLLGKDELLKYFLLKDFAIPPLETAAPDAWNEMRSEYMERPRLTPTQARLNRDRIATELKTNSFQPSLRQPMLFPSTHQNDEIWAVLEQAIILSQEKATQEEQAKAIAAQKDLEEQVVREQQARLHISEQEELLKTQTVQLQLTDHLEKVNNQPDLQQNAKSQQNLEWLAEVAALDSAERRAKQAQAERDRVLKEVAAREARLKQERAAVEQERMEFYRHFQEQETNSRNQAAGHERFMRELNSAVALFKAGDKAGANVKLRELQFTHPADANVLLWLAYTTPDLRESRVILDNLERIDPYHPQLSMVRDWIESQARSTATNTDTREKSNTGIDESQGSHRSASKDGSNRQNKPAAGSTSHNTDAPPKVKNRSLMSPVIISAAVITILLITGLLAYFLFFQSGTVSTTSPSNPEVAAEPCQPGQIKGSQSKIYHLPDQNFYAVTKVNVTCFNSESEAQAAGFRKAKT